MLKQLFFVICLIGFLACQNKENNRTRAARVFDNYLYFDQLPTPPNSKDSVIFTTNFINQWATKELLLNKAKFNIGDSIPSYIDSLVQRYKSSLLTHYYKQFLIQMHLDTIVHDTLVSMYYQNNIDNFQLKEDLVKLNYVKIKTIAPNIKYLKDHFPSNSNEFQDYCLQFSEKFFLGDVEWVSWLDVVEELPVDFFDILMNTKKNLKKNNIIELKDSTYQYFIFIQDFKLKGMSSPLEYVSSLVKKIIINKRKKELVNNIERDLVEDALINNKFEIYD